MTTLDEARNFAIYLRSAQSPWMEHNKIYEARQQAATIIDGLIAMVEAQAWQPIETAPRERLTNTFDLFALGKRYADCWYYGGRWQYHSGQSTIYDVPAPTHWRPNREESEP